MARGEEPPFDLEDLLRRYGSSPPNSEVRPPPSSSALVRNPSDTTRNVVIYDENFMIFLNSVTIAQNP